MQLEFKITFVYVWTSKQYKSQSEPAFVYGASLRLKEYALAFPITSPAAAAAVPVALLSEHKSTVWLLFKPIKGVPWTLLTFILFPNSRGTNAPSIFFISLGLSTSTTVVPGL